jgi:hypothetical protein
MPILADRPATATFPKSSALSVRIGSPSRKKTFLLTSFRTVSSRRTWPVHNEVLSLYLYTDMVIFIINNARGGSGRNGLAVV